MITEEKFIFDKSLDVFVEGEVTHKSHSNIALVKYWGKTGEQIPANPSLSFTLRNCTTITTLKFVPSSRHSFKVFVEGKREASFEPKIRKFFIRIVKYCSYIAQYEFTIDTMNTFPHSSGIASSASGFSALALCIMSLERDLNPAMTDEFFKQKASFLARLGSGSACRSVYPGIVEWGRSEEFEGSSDLVAIPFNEAHEVFKDFQDTILLVDKGEKEVSSTVGHGLMYNHPFAEARFEQARQHLAELKKALIEGKVKEFTRIVESEALTLHAMMMTSNPYFILMKANTLKIIEEVWAYRKKHNLNLTITLDAGANVHLLYPKQETEQAMQLINETLVHYCEKGNYIMDEVNSENDDFEE